MNAATAELAEKLEMVRQAQDWSYQELAENIEEATGRHRNEDCWRKICLGSTPHPRRTTLNIARDFLKDFAGQRRPAKAQKRAS
jgi:hypothetical protein